jgi:hypothetical protein
MSAARGLLVFARKSISPSVYVQNFEDVKSCYHSIHFITDKGGDFRFGCFNGSVQTAWLLLIFTDTFKQAMAEVLAISSGIAGLLSLTLDVLSVSYKYYTGIREGHKTLLAFQRELQGLLEVLSNIEANTAQDPDLAGAFSWSPDLAIAGYY